MKHSFLIMKNLKTTSLSGQSNKVFESILEKFKKGLKQFSILIDPDKYTPESLLNVINEANSNNIDFFLIGGSLLSEDIEKYTSIIKENSEIPVILFPGSFFQITSKADAILFLSLISGRNPDYLINNQVIAAPYIKKKNLEAIPTSYILVEGEKTTSVEYISNTKPIPSDKTDIIKATAIAGEMLGHKIIYLEAGSGASKAISAAVISEIKKSVNLPLIVGGGIKTPGCVSKLISAGADIIVVGNSIEENPELIEPLNDIIRQHNNK